MKLSLLLIIFHVFIIIPIVYAQSSPGKISGVVLDAQAHTLPGATIRLLYNGETTNKKTSVTNTNGAFHLTDLKNGIYSLSISNVGFTPYSNTHLVIDDTHSVIQLPPVVLIPSSGQVLKGVTITSKKPLIEQKIDRTVVNVDAMLSATGSSALEVLSKSPGVIVDDNGGISLNGKSNVFVLIDDRPTYMSGQDLAAYLRSLPGGTLDKLELISNPPARYDASGNAIINIVLKKNKASGFNGALNLGYNQGVYARSNDAMNVNYRSKSFNLFSSLSYSHDQNYSEETFNRYFYNPDGTQNAATLQNSRYTYQSNSFNGRIGMDYFVSSKTTIGFVLSGNTRPKSDLLNYADYEYNGNMQLDSITKGNTSEKYSWHNTGINLNFQQKLDSSGSVLTANLDYLNYNSGSDQTSPFTIYGADGLLKNSYSRTFTLPSAINIYAGKVDYALPLAGKAEFDAGIKSSNVNTDSQSDWFDQQNGGLVPDYSKSNHFRYTENISSTYVNFRKQWNRWAFQGGLRLENTAATGHQFGNPSTADSSFTRNYTNLFPSLYLLRKLDSSGNNTLVLSFSKRVRRPSYQQVNPFLFFHDQYTYTAGNPNLTAAFAQYVELKYAYKQFFGVTISYGGGNNGISSLTKVQGDILTTSPYNFINNRMYGIIPYVSISPLPWWSMNFNAVLLYQINKGNAAGILIDQRTNVHEFETTNQFQLSKTWSAELDGFFPGKQAFGQTKSGSIYNISAGIQKNIMHGNGTIRFNMNDIFHSLSINSQTIGISQVAAFNTRETDSRWTGVSFTYRFGKSANARRRNDNGSAEDEKGRTN